MPAALMSNGALMRVYWVGAGTYADIRYRNEINPVYHQAFIVFDHLFLLPRDAFRGHG